MKKTIYLLMLLLSVALLMVASCSKEKSVIGKMELIDSLGWQDDVNYSFSEITDIHATDKYLYVADYNRGNVLVYDASTLKYIKTIGAKGEGPGEAKSSGSLTGDNQGNILLLSLIDRKLLKFDKDGNLLKEHVFNIFPARVEGSPINDYVYIRDYSTTEPCLYELIDDSLRKTCSIKEIMDENNIDSFWGRMCILNDKILVNFVHSEHLFEITKDGKVTKVQFEKPVLEYSEKSMGDMYPYKDGFLYFMGSYKQAETVEDYENKEFLIHYDNNYKMKRQWEWEQEVFYPGILAVNGNIIYVLNPIEMMIYKYKLL